MIPVWFVGGALRSAHAFPPPAIRVRSAALAGRSTRDRDRRAWLFTQFGADGWVTWQNPPSSGLPPILPQPLGGFPNHVVADGEGSFNVVFRKRQDYTMPWKVSACFNVSQRDEVILALFKRHLRCGTLRRRRDGVWYYEVNNRTAITKHVIPFFDRFTFLSAKKKRDFSKFKHIVQLMQQGAHLHQDGIRQILAIRRDMNDGGAKRRQSRIRRPRSMVPKLEA